MPNSRVIQFRVTNQQFDAIKANAMAEGYKVVSNYLRTLGLNGMLEKEERIKQILNNTQKTFDLLQRVATEKWQMKTIPNGKKF